jgi:hypothetical protein
MTVASNRLLLVYPGVDDSSRLVVEIIIAPDNSLRAVATWGDGCPPIEVPVSRRLRAFVDEVQQALAEAQEKQRSVG